MKSYLVTQNLFSLNQVLKAGQISICKTFRLWDFMMVFPRKPSLLWTAKVQCTFLCIFSAQIAHITSPSLSDTSLYIYKIIYIYVLCILFYIYLFISVCLIQQGQVLCLEYLVSAKGLAILSFYLMLFLSHYNMSISNINITFLDEV